MANQEFPSAERSETNLHPELPDTPVNRLLTQSDTESSYKPQLFSRFIEQPTIAESVSAQTKHFATSIKTKSNRVGGPFFIFGVAMPASAIFLELLAGVCANLFFDPIPTIWHKLLVCSVPLANLAIWWELRNDDAEYNSWLGAASGLTLGVSVFYALLFLPLLPFALLGIIFMGIGALGFSPQLAFITAIRGAIKLGRVKLLRPSDKPQLSYAACLIAGIAVSLGGLIALEIKTTLTRINLQRATSTNPTTSLEAIRWLRAYANEKTLLEACYWHPVGATDLVGTLMSLGNPVDAESAQTIFYRVTGKTYNSRPKPKVPTGNFRLIDFDNDRGTDQINGVIKNLSLSSSRIDGSIDADAALGYFEWTMIFKNATPIQQEARAQVQLPAGGAVSRLTLWVDGEPREAAFASRGKVREAYEAVVRTRRDPVLVTSSGDDKVLVQCFPVPPNGEMKIRFGVTAPVTLETIQRGWLRLPTIVERNFQVDDLNHAVWFEAKRELQSSSKSLLTERPEHKLFAVRGSLTDKELSSGQASIGVERSTDTSEFWTPDPMSKTFDAIHQTIEARDWQRPQRVVLVIDASTTRQVHLDAIANSIKRMPEGIELIALSSGDEITDLTGESETSAKFYDFVADKIRRINPVGGNDNLQALNKAWDLAAQKPGSAILWIHEEKPVLIGNADELRQRWERRPDSPQMFDLPLAGGPNRVAEKLDGIEAVENIASGDLAKDLDRLFARWRGETKQLVIRRERVARQRQELSKDLQETSSHLARLWALDETRRLIADKKIENAIQLAASYQLVTPVSGAVVLETAEQYKRAGLEPVPPNSVPTIPEPEEWLLMFVALAVLLWMTCRRRFAWRSA